LADSNPGHREARAAGSAAASTTLASCYETWIIFGIINT
jgi:hypothetical protein